MTYILTFTELLKLKIKYDVKTHRLRCQGHIINLAVNSFLFVTDSDNPESDDETDNNNKYKVSLEEIEQWRRKGPLGKMHNFVVFIQASVQREQLFWEYSHRLQLVRDNNTWWNSWYNMLERALDLKDAIIQYSEDYPDDLYKLDILTEEEWETIDTIMTFLQKLKMATKAAESSNSCLDVILPLIDFVLSQFEAAKVKYANDDILSPMVNSGWAKMDQYYQLTDQSPAYAVALVLNPKFKWKYIDKKWNKA